jgi:predicted Zn-dependent protease
VEDADRAYFERQRPGRLEESNRSLETLLAASPEDAAVLWRLARGLVRAGERGGDKKSALADFTRAESLAGMAVSLSSASADAWYWHGVALGKQGEARGMMRSLFMVGPLKRRMEGALRLAPRHGPAHHVLGELLWQLPGVLGGSKAGARRELEAALAADPSYTAPYPTLAEVYLEGGLRKEADALLPRILAVEKPADPAEYADNVADLRKVLGPAQSP